MDSLDALRTGWFDITKADWRRDHGPASAVGNGGRPRGDVPLRPAPAVRVGGLLLGAIGLAALVRTNRRRAALLATAYLVNVLFAYSYNVGDAHVFYLPSHMMIALLAAPGAVLVAQALMAGWARLEPDPTTGHRLRADRFSSGGPGRLRADRICGPPDPSRLSRAGPQRGSAAGCRAERADRRHRRALDDPAHGSELAGPERSVLLRQPPAARDRLRAHGRRPALRARRSSATTSRLRATWSLTAGARDGLIGAYGPLIPTVADARVESPGISGLVRDLAPGTPIRARRAETVARFHAGHRRSEPRGCGVERRSAGVDAGWRLRRAGGSHRRTRPRWSSARLNRSGAGSVWAASRSRCAWSRGWPPIRSGAWGSAR